jgi:ferredoxin-thioredoxin reductase catalytic subunit
VSAAREKSLEQVAEFARRVASHQGWRLNPEERFRGVLIQGLQANYNRYGYFLCPCRDGAGVREQDRDIICPCAYARPDIDEYGHCFCALYLSEAFLASGREAQSIPERRP